MLLPKIFTLHNTCRLVVVDVAKVVRKCCKWFAKVQLPPVGVKQEGDLTFYPLGENSDPAWSTESKTSVPTFSWCEPLVPSPLESRAVRRPGRAAAADNLWAPPPTFVDRRAAAAADNLSALRRYHCCCIVIFWNFR